MSRPGGYSGLPVSLHSPSMPARPYLIPPSTSVLSPSKPGCFHSWSELHSLTPKSICTCCSDGQKWFFLLLITYPSPHPSDFGLNVTCLEKSCLVFLFMSNALSETLPALRILPFVTSIPGKMIHSSLWLFTELLLASSRISAPFGQESCLFWLITVFPGPVALPVTGQAFNICGMSEWMAG